MRYYDIYSGNEVTRVTNYGSTVFISNDGKEVKDVTTRIEKMDLKGTTKYLFWLIFIGILVWVGLIFLYMFLYFILVLPLSILLRIILGKKYNPNIHLPPLNIRAEICTIGVPAGIIFGFVLIKSIAFIILLCTIINVSIYLCISFYILYVNKRHSEIYRHI